MKKRCQLTIWTMLFLAVLGSGWLLAQTAVAAGSTVTVNEITDLADENAGDGVCDTNSGLPDDQCTLRAAIEELNAQGAGGTPHHIQFDIAGSGPFTITPGSPLPAITVPLVIDGASQTGATCPTNSQTANLLIILDGSGAGPGEDGLVLDNGSDGSTVRGLVIGNFDSDGIRLNSDQNTVRCSHIGVNADGVSPMGNSTTGIFVSGDLNEIGGSNAHAARNIISANGRPIQLYGSANIVVNNFIGTTADGMADLGNSSGIPIALDDNTIGGSAPLARNVISGSGGYAIYISQADNTHILGNYIGVARDGLTPLANDGDGIIIYGDASGNLIGGSSDGEGNVIAHNDGTGVMLSASGSLIPEQNEIRGNAIYENAELGIELSGDSNGGQNYPVLVSTPGSPVVTATLNGQPSTIYAVDVFRSQSCDPSGYGEGQHYLGPWQIMTDGAGQVTFDLDLAGMVVNGSVVTATATDPTGNSSEFSNCVTMASPIYYVHLPLILN